MKKTTPIALTAALLVLTPIANAQNFINGSFEDGLTSHPNYNPPIGSAKDTVPDGWDLFSDPNTYGPMSSPDWIGGAATGVDTLATDGYNSLGIDYYRWDEGDVLHYTGISQSVSGFDIGQEYRFSLDAAVVATEGLSPVGALDIYFNEILVHSLTITNSFDPGDIPFAVSPLQPYFYDFTAAAETLVIGIRANTVLFDETESITIVMDNLNLTSVPEPSGALLLTLAGTLALLRRRRLG